MASIFSVTLTGDQEVAAVPVVTDASGTGTVVWDEAANTATYTITVRNLDFGTALGLAPQTADPLDDVTGMHVHAQARGANGLVVFGQVNPAQDTDDRDIVLNADGSWTIRGVWETTDPATQPITNFAAALTAAVVGADVGLYFNVHSQQFMGGEVRGQWVAAGNTQDGTNGDDTIAAPAGEALLSRGGQGNDSITSGALTDVLFGGGGNDTLLGNDGDDTVAGGGGNDSINTGVGNDLIRGGDGDDSIGGMAGRDTVEGGRGNDFIAWNDPTGDLVSGGAGDDTIIGGNIAADTIEGGAGADSIQAFATAPADATAGDTIAGGAGNDTIAGGDSADALSGGADDDVLSGNGGDDTIAGGSGNDSINTGLGNDLVSGGAGNDTIGGMAGNDTVDGGAGDDVIAWNDPTGDLVSGGAGDDTIIGGNIAADTIAGGAGDDSIRAFATAPGDATAADVLSGGAGNDTIAGGNADDTIEGGAGEDDLTGNGGNDVFVFRDGQATGADVITDFATGDLVRLEGFGAGFDPLAALSASGGDTFLALGGGDSVLFQGRAIGDFTLADFVIA